VDPFYYQDTFSLNHFKAYFVLRGNVLLRFSIYSKELFVQTKTASSKIGKLQQRESALIGNLTNILRSAFLNESFYSQLFSACTF